MRHPSRRHVIAGLSAGLALAPAIRVIAGPRLPRDPFLLGVASGWPRGDSVVLWTRLLADDGIDTAVEVSWQLSEDEAFTRIAAEGVETAIEAQAHSVHVEARGLQPARWYWYRFQAGGWASAVGRTRTAPAEGAATDRLRLALASCQQYEQGWFSAYRHMAAKDFDLVVHVGDYIYELSWGARKIRRHGTGIPTSLPEFRDRYALYKADPDLQAAHAAFPWITTWDDHEVADDYWNDRAPRSPDPGFFLRVRAAAYQAYWEHMPLPPSMAPRNGALRLYDRFGFGNLVDLATLDDRQYRSPRACLVPTKSSHEMIDCPERTDAARSVLGTAQEAWLDDMLHTSKARWTVVAQQTLMAELARGKPEAPTYWMDGWDGYPAARQRLLDGIAAHKPANPVILGGDRHAFWVADLKRERGPTIATEFVGTSITSDGPSADSVQSALRRNPHLRYGEGDRRGYAALDFQADRLTVGFEALDDVREKEAKLSRLATFVVEAGRTGAHQT